MRSPFSSTQHLRFITGPIEGSNFSAPDEERRHQIAEAAYFKALSRGFTPGHEREDWLEAEREVDARRYFDS